MRRILSSLSSTALLALASGSVFEFPNSVEAAIDGFFTSIPQGSSVNLSAIANLDWVHWGLYTESTVNRKWGVPGLIGQPRPVGIGGGVYVFRFSDNFNGYSWSDGYPETSVTNSTTGIWVYALHNRGSGFEISVPAGSNEMILHLFVGAFAAQGTLEAALSDESGSWTDSQLDNSPGNGPSAIYMLRYSALSEGQSLTIRWTLLGGTRGDANLTLQAAALSAPGTNYLPIVNLSSPAPNQNVAFGSSITLSASALDVDGTVAKVEFFADTNLFLGETTAEPYTSDWKPSAPGLYYITAIATDDLGGIRQSPALPIFVHSSTGGIVRGRLGSPEAQVNLTLSGSLDWMHWGLLEPTNINRKSDVVPLISDFPVLGTNTLIRFTNYATAFSWTDGTPTAVELSSKTGVYVTGPESGFELHIPAGNDLHRLNMYVGVYGAAGLFQAFLSDASAPLYADNSLNYIYNTRYALYTVDFAAAAPGTTLTVRYLKKNLYDLLYGNISLSSVTLGEVRPRIERLILAGNEVLVAFRTEPAGLYTLEYSDSLAPVDWKALEAFIGTGEEIQAVDPTPFAEDQRFYRLRLDWDLNIPPPGKARQP